MDQQIKTGLTDHQKRLAGLQAERDDLARELSSHEVADQSEVYQRRYTAVESELAAVQFAEHLYGGDHTQGRDDLQRIARAFMQMPYGGGRLMGPRSSNGLLLSLSDIAYNVECMAESLAYHAQSDATEQEELLRYRRLVSAGRDLFAMLTAEDAS